MRASPAVSATLTSFGTVDARRRSGRRRSDEQRDENGRER